MSTTHPWWFDAVVYQVYVRSFADGLPALLGADDDAPGFNPADPTVAKAAGRAARGDPDRAARRAACDSERQ